LAEKSTNELRAGTGRFPKVSRRVSLSVKLFSSLRDPILFRLEVPHSYADAFEYESLAVLIPQVFRVAQAHYIFINIIFSRQ